MRRSPPPAATTSRHGRRCRAIPAASAVGIRRSRRILKQLQTDRCVLAGVQRALPRDGRDPAVSPTDSVLRTNATELAPRQTAPITSQEARRSPTRPQASVPLRACGRLKQQHRPHGCVGDKPEAAQPSSYGSFWSRGSIAGVALWWPRSLRPQRLCLAQDGLPSPLRAAAFTIPKRQLMRVSGCLLGLARCWDWPWLCPISSAALRTTAIVSIGSGVPLKPGTGALANRT